MENPKPRKSSVGKLIGAFIAGVVITAIVMLATTGTLFSGNLRAVTLDRNVKLPSYDVEKLKICDDNCELEQQIEALKSQDQYIWDFLNNWQFTGNLPIQGETNRLDNRIDYTWDFLNHWQFTGNLPVHGQASIIENQVGYVWEFLNHWQFTGNLPVRQ